MKQLMRRIEVLILLLLLFFTNIAFGINIYRSGDTLYIWSKSGLVLRDTNSSIGTKLQTIPYGSYVVSEDYKPYRYEDEFSVTIIDSHVSIDEFSNRKVVNPAVNIKGRWLKVKFLNQEGYVFDGYLSHFQPPIASNFKYDGFISQYLSETFKILKKTRYSDDKMAESSCEYGGGISYNSVGFDGSVNTYYYIPSLSFDEVLLLFLYSGFIVENEEYLTTSVIKCTHTCSRKVIFHYCCALQTITITEIGMLTIVEFKSAC